MEFKFTSILPIKAANFGFRTVVQNQVQNKVQNQNQQQPGLKSKQVQPQTEFEIPIRKAQNHVKRGSEPN